MFSAIEGRPRQIVRYNSPPLREVLPAFDWDNPEHLQGCADLRATILDTQNARGLAANQIGLRARVFAVKIEGWLLGMFVNPSVVSSSVSTAVAEEECLSYPNLRVKVQRPESGLVMWEQEKGVTSSAQLDGLTFRCFLHELDHLNGITLDVIRRRAQT